MNGRDSSIAARSLSKIYRRGSEEVRAVNGVSLRVQPGEFLSFVGASGSGKTTLLNLLGCLDNPTDGELDLYGRSIVTAGRPLSERALTRIRRETFGYVFQNFYLIPTLTVLENVLLPLSFYRSPRADSNVLPILERLGIAQRSNHLPDQISGGEMQRVAIARALVNRPRILLADEPTGNLDTQRAAEIGEVVADLNRREGLTIIMVTHNPVIARLGHRVLEMQDGIILTGTAPSVPAVDEFLPHDKARDAAALGTVGSLAALGLEER